MIVRCSKRLKLDKIENKFIFNFIFRYKSFPIFYKSNYLSNISIIHFDLCRNIHFSLKINFFLRLFVNLKFKFPSLIIQISSFSFSIVHKSFKFSTLYPIVLNIFLVVYVVFSSQTASVFFFVFIIDPLHSHSSCSK